MKPSLRHLLPQLPMLHLVDIGANPIDGKAPYTTLLENGLAQLIGFEPNESALAILNQQKSERERYLPYALGDGKSHTFYQCQAPGMSSLLKPNAQTLSFFHGFPTWGKVLQEIPIQTHRLDNLEEVQQIDYLKIDIQGGELMVFQHAKQKLKDCLVVHTEVEFLPMYENQPLFSEVELFLRKLGFVFHKFQPLVSRVVQPLMMRNDPYAGLNQQLWADAIFIKNFMNLEQLSEEQLQKYALILHDVYQSYDVALRALIALDRRKGTTYSRLYGEQILK